MRDGHTMMDDLYINDNKQKGHKRVDDMLKGFCFRNQKKLENMLIDSIVHISDIDAINMLLPGAPFDIRWIGKLPSTEGNCVFVFLNSRMDNVFSIDYLGARDRH